MDFVVCFKFHGEERTLLNENENESERVCACVWMVLNGDTMTNCAVWEDEK